MTGLYFVLLEGANSKILAVDYICLGLDKDLKDWRWDNDSIAFFDFILLFHCRVPSDNLQ